MSERPSKRAAPDAERESEWVQEWVTEARESLRRLHGIRRAFDGSARDAALEMVEYALGQVVDLLPLLKPTDQGAFFAASAASSAARELEHCLTEEQPATPSGVAHAAWLLGRAQAQIEAALKKKQVPGRPPGPMRKAIIASVRELGLAAKDAVVSSLVEERIGERPTDAWVAQVRREEGLRAKGK